jgi:hypothetical protein
MAHRASFDVPHVRCRTGIATGRDVLNGVDGRSHVARRYREVGALIASDVGGSEHLSEAQKQLVRSAAGLVVLRERLDALAANGEPVDSGEYCALANTLRRLLATLGLQRVAKEIEDPGLVEYERELARLDEAEDVQEG